MLKVREFRGADLVARQRLSSPPRRRPPLPTRAFACDNGKPLLIDLGAPGGAKVDYDGKTYTLKKISGGVDGLTFKTGDVSVWSKETDLIITIANSPLQSSSISNTEKPLIPVARTVVQRHRDVGQPIVARARMRCHTIVTSGCFPEPLGGVHDEGAVVSAEAKEIFMMRLRTLAAI